MRKKKKGRALLGGIMVLTMLFGSFIGIVPEMSITALAEEATFSPASAYTEYENLIKSDTTVKIDGVQYNGTDVDWFVIGYDSTEKVVTLLSHIGACHQCGKLTVNLTDTEAISFL